MIMASSLLGLKKPRLFGLLITRNDMPIFSRWMQRHGSLFTKLAVVDGSDDELTRECCHGYANVVYRKDPEPPITDQTLRAAAWSLLEGLVRRGDWIMICHPDEFYIHDPRKFLSTRSPVIRWSALHVLPHPSEKAAWARGDAGGDVTHLFRHYWWKEDGSATVENRMFRLASPLEWDRDDQRPSSSVLPQNYQALRPWNRRPIYLHYKIQHLNPSKFRGTKYVDSRLDTGLGTAESIESQDDFFFDEIRPWGHKGFVRCSDDPDFPGFDQFKGRYRLPPISDSP